MKAPTVAVVIATRDRPRLLADALASVASQRVSPLEVRIADDGDLPIAEALATPGLLEMSVVPAAARSAGAARNRAARGARAEVLAFLDDDDLWLPDHLQGLAGAFVDPAVQVAYRDVAVVRERLGPGDRRIAGERRVIARDWDASVMRRDDYLAPSAMAFRRRFFERLGGFDESYRYSEDWDLLLRAAAWTVPHRVEGVTVEVRLREAGNASANVGPERRACLERLAVRHGLRPIVAKTFWEVALDVARDSERGATTADARERSTALSGSGNRAREAGSFDSG